MKKILIALALVAGLLFSLTPALADTYTYGFEKLETNTNEPGANFELVVTNDGLNANEVKFTIKNLASSGEVAEIYVYDGILKASGQPVVIQDSPTPVDFTEGATPADVPGGAAVGLQVQGNAGSWFAADSTNDEGLNTGESVSFLFTLNQDKTINDVKGQLDDWLALSLAGKQGIDWETNLDYIAVALHVRELDDPNKPGIDTDGSDTFVVVPLPGALLLMGAGLVRLVAYRRRRNIG
jgi:hypothetical protein